MEDRRVSPLELKQIPLTHVVGEVLRMGLVPHGEVPRGRHDMHGSVDPNSQLAPTVAHGGNAGHAGDPGNTSESSQPPS